MSGAPAPWLASLLSLTLPGAGQLYSGKAMRGAGFFAGIVLVLLLAAYLLVVLISSFGMVLDVVLTFGFIVFAAVDAWRLAARWPRDTARPAYTRWFVLVPAYLLGIIALDSLNTFRKEHIAETFRYPSTAMEPTLLVGDHFIVDRRRLARMPLRQALVAYESVETAGLKVAKRFVGMPNDTIEMRAGVVFLNGRPLEEPYLAPATEVYEADSALRKQMRAWQSSYLAGRKDSGYWPTLNDWGPLVVPPGSYFALGDNRNTSYDSRETGFIPVSHILGRASHVYLSIDPAGGIRWSRLGKALR